MVNKHCCYGTCTNDSRKFGQPGHPEMEGVFFIPFVKPARQLKKCKEWIRLCGRPHDRLNVEILDSHKGRNIYICSKHFVGGNGPTDEYPNPIPALQLGTSSPNLTKVRKPPRFRASTPIKTSHLSVTETTSSESFFNDHDYTSKIHTDLMTESSNFIDFSININDEFTRIVNVSLNDVVETEIVEDNLDEFSDMDVESLSDIVISKDAVTQTENSSIIREEFVRKVTNDNHSCLFWTGISSLTLLNYIFEWVLPASQMTPLWMGKKRYEERKEKRSVRRKRKLSSWDEYLLTLIRIRRSFDVNEIATFFDITPGHVSHVFITWINILYKYMHKLIEWPSADFVSGNMPESFKKLFPSTRVIIDCSEIFVQTPRNIDAQKETYSSYKSHNTFKFLLGIAPSGQVTFLSKLFSGSISDREIVKLSGFLDLIEPNDNVMADRGFNIRDLCLKKQAYLNIPAFSDGKQLSARAVTHSRKIASVRIHVERAMERLKNFNIINGIIPLQLKNSLDQILTVITVLGNLNSPLVTK